jgi:hypothetical protein
MMAPLPPPPTPTPTLDAIYAAYVAEADDGFRDHLGASIIGKDCERALWYDFRWVTRACFTGRMLRLFDTGRREEERLVRDLRRTGATVLDADPQTGRQWQVAALGGHFGGSLDAVAIDLLEAPKTWHVVEFKTHGTKSFAGLKRDGVQRSKPQHWAQMQVYMHLTGIARAMYVAVGKDTDEIHIERVRADPAEGQRLIAKAKRVIDAPLPPAKISDDPTWWECRLCEHHDHCHGDRPAERNCRTCLHSTPVNGGWHCARWNGSIGPNEQRCGCASHLFIPDLVPGMPVDAGEDWIEYRMPDGTIWVNGTKPDPGIAAAVASAGARSFSASAETFPWTSPPTGGFMAGTENAEKGHD